MELVAFIIICVVVWLGIRVWRTFHLSQLISHQVINRFGEQCKKCQQTYYICPICGCQKETQRDADVCADWDKILGKDRHPHEYLHNHEEEE